MYSKNIDFSKFLNNLDAYLKKDNIKLAEYSLTLLDFLIEDPSMQRLIAIWLMTDNTIQLNYLFTKTLPALGNLATELQESALSHMFERARTISSAIPAPTDFDMVLESIGEKPDNSWDGWKDFNHPLFNCSEREINQLSKYEFFINNGVFTANTVAAMKAGECAAFDARVDQIISENADFIYPDQIFSDKLIKLMKKDMIIQDILAGVDTSSQVVEIKSNPDLDSEHTDIDLLSVTSSDVEMLQQNSQDNLNALLGLDDDDSISSEDQTEEESELSDLTPNNLEATQLSHDSDISTTEAQPGFWQVFNIQLYQLENLIRKGELRVNEIPNRELTDKEVAIYRLMNRMLKDFSPADVQEDEYSIETIPERYMQTQAEKPSSLPPTELKQNLHYPSSQTRMQKVTSSVSYEAWKASRAQSNSISHEQSKKDFHAGIKQPTHNRKLQRHIEDEARIQQERLAREPKSMPNWHKEYMQRHRNQAQQATNKSEEQNLPSKFGKF